MTWGATAYVVKSSDLTELKQKIREVLENRGKLLKSGSISRPALQGNLK